jgi:hypothetical protein
MSKKPSQWSIDLANEIRAQHFHNQAHADGFFVFTLGPLEAARLLDAAFAEKDKRISAERRLRVSGQKEKVKRMEGL